MQLLNLTPVDAFLDPYDAALTSTPPSSRFATAKRSHLAGELRASHAGAKVKLGGWVHRIRNLGGIVFLDLRDRAGLIQVSFDPKWTPPAVIERAGKLGLETVILVEGDVAARPTEMRNAEMETGEVEVRARDFRIVGPASLITTCWTGSSPLVCARIVSSGFFETAVVVSGGCRDEAAAFFAFLAYFFPACFPIRMAPLGYDGRHYAGPLKCLKK